MTRDITNECCRTPSGRITSALEVAQHLRETFCTSEWLTDHLYMQINEIVVMYLGTDEINRPASPPDVSPCKGIQSHYSFLFLGTPGHYAMRKWSCWCPACSRMRGRGYGAISQSSYLVVPDCQRKKLTIWEEDKFNVKAASGQREREKRAAETLKKELPKAKPGKWGCTQVRELWGDEEIVHLRPGHHWLFEFGDAGDGTCFATLPNGKKEFTLPARKWVVYKGVRFYNGDKAIVVKRWLHRLAEDASGLTFVEWDPEAEADPDAPPAELILNSSQLRAAGFSLTELLPPQLESLARYGASRGTRSGAGLQQLQGMGPTKFLLHVDNDNEYRSRCE